MAKQSTTTAAKKGTPPRAKERAKKGALSIQSRPTTVNRRGLELPGPVSPTSEPQVFRALRDAFGLTQQEMRSLAGISVRKISGLETGEQKPTRDDVRRFNELRRLREELAAITAPEAIADWLQMPNEYFGGISPMQIIERGEADRLWRLIWRLQDGVPVN